jgi:exoribonuclease II
MYLNMKQLQFVYEELRLTMENYNDMINDYKLKKVIQENALVKSNECSEVRDKIIEEIKERERRHKL